MSNTEISLKVLYHSGLVTVSALTEEEVQKYREMQAGITQNSECIRWIADIEGERQILEQYSDKVYRIFLNKQHRK